jgi:hypothetical protein
MGKTPIVPAWGGYLEYIDDLTGWPVPVHEVSPVGLDPAWDTMTADSRVGAIDGAALRRALRAAYESKDVREEKGRNGVLRALSFFFGKVGVQMLDAITTGPPKGLVCPTDTGVPSSPKTSNCGST